ncbi:MAG TPA: hypothetical protein VKB46_16770, partial [Pyrinomonadaceae bacterium]|nr:hypothetical protein [Pyrinomonadaceae bacterium]
HPTNGELVDSFKSFLQEGARTQTEESHQRQLVDRSSPPYKRVPPKPRNPTNCRWWDSFGSAALLSRKDLKHPPTAVGGILGAQAGHLRSQWGDRLGGAASRHCLFGLRN